MNILVINAGSSSLKYQLMDPETGAVTAKGLCERIGNRRPSDAQGSVPGQEGGQEIPMPRACRGHCRSSGNSGGPENGVIAATDEIDAVGHRVLHGGDKFIAFLHHQRSL